MRRPIRLVPLDRTMQLPLTLAGGLRTTFADVLFSPLPDRLAALVRRLSADRDERSGGGTMGQAQQKRRAVLVVEDGAELPSLMAALFGYEQVGSIQCES